MPLVSSEFCATVYWWVTAHSRVGTENKHVEWHLNFHVGEVIFFVPFSPPQNITNQSSIEGCMYSLLFPTYVIDVVLLSLPFKVFVILLTTVCLAVTIMTTLRGRPAGPLPRQWNNRKYGASKLGFPHTKGFLRKLSPIWARVLKTFRQLCHRPKRFKEHRLLQGIILLACQGHQIICLSGAYNCLGPALLTIQ
jgi:hypothetical protein